MTELIMLVEPAPEGDNTARALAESIFTEADTLPELREGIREAIACHFDQGQAPKIIRLHIVREEILQP